MVAISCATFMIGPLSPPSAAASAAAFFGVVAADAEQPLARDAGRHRADVGADPHVARRPRRKPVLLFVLAVVQNRPPDTSAMIENLPFLAARLSGNVSI